MNDSSQTKTTTLAEKLAPYENLSKLYNTVRQPATYLIAAPFVWGASYIFGSVFLSGPQERAELNQLNAKTNALKMVNTDAAPRVSDAKLLGAKVYNLTGNNGQPDECKLVLEDGSATLYFQKPNTRFAHSCASLMPAIRSSIAFTQRDSGMLATVSEPVR